VQRVCNPVHGSTLALPDWDTDGDGTLHERLHDTQDAEANATALVG
jgi:hypothetical protein